MPALFSVQKEKTSKHHNIALFFSPVFGIIKIIKSIIYSEGSQQ